MFIRSICTILFSILFSSFSIACNDIPADQIQNHEALIKRTPNIVLAEAINVRAINSEYYNVLFKVKKLLKGFQTKNFTLTGRLANDTKGKHDYDAHNDLSFWVYDNIGNFTRSESCHVFGHFQPNKQYLIFLDPPHHPRSFELIVTEEDDWYQEVAKLIDKEEAIANAVELGSKQSTLQAN